MRYFLNFQSLKYLQYAEEMSYYNLRKTLAPLWSPYKSHHNADYLVFLFSDITKWRTRLITFLFCNWSHCGFIVINTVGQWGWCLFEVVFRFLFNDLKKYIGILTKLGNILLKLQRWKIYTGFKKLYWKLLEHRKMSCWWFVGSGRKKR